MYAKLSGLIMENKIYRLEHVQSRHFSFSQWSSSRRGAVLLLIFAKCCVKTVSSCLYFAVAFRMCALVCWVELLRGYICYYFITFLAIFFFVHRIYSNVYLNKQIIFDFFYHNVCMQIESKQAVRKYRREDRAGKWMFLSILSAWMFTQGHN